MKKYYGYSETSNKTYWKYYKNKFKYPPITELIKNPDLGIDKGRIDIRYCSFCYKSQMIKIIGKKINSKNWVRERISETGNENDITLSNTYKNFIVVRND